MLRCLAIDDEPLALDLLESNIQKIPFLELKGKCKNGFEAIEMLEKEAIDLIFLDIQMPGLTGIQLLNALKASRPMVIFITAYEKFAVEGYSLDVLDYLMKPVSFERFYKACQKAKELFELKNGQKNEPEIQYTEGGDTQGFFFVNAEYSLIKIVEADILHIEGMKDYLKIFLSSQPKPVITRMSLKAMEEKLPKMGFIRVHKSYIVNIAHIKSIRNSTIFIEKHSIPLSDNMRDELMRILKIE